MANKSKIHEKSEQMAKTAAGAPGGESGVPISTQASSVYDRLQSDILTGKLKPGHKLRLKDLIEHENTVVASPHKVYGPESNDLALQLRKLFQSAA